MGGLTVVKIDMERMAQLAEKHPDAANREFHALSQVDFSESAVAMSVAKP